jgi:D-alanine-D-alanine ligase
MSRVLLLFGGRSSEHAISCLSAANVEQALGKAGHEPVCVGITPTGRWTLAETVPRPTNEAPLPQVDDANPTVTLVANRGHTRLLVVEERGDTLAMTADLGVIDVAFPVLHGPHGEDGTVQGLLATSSVPYVGADVASSALGIDKRQMKAVFASRGLPQLPYTAVSRREWDEGGETVLDRLDLDPGLPVFTKPARQGSSIGVRRCHSRAEVRAGLAEAFVYDRVVIVEQALSDAREIECGVLGNAAPEVSRPGELVHAGQYYDFDAKYLSPVELTCPAPVPEAISERCRELAREAFHGIGARGLARVDFFYLDAEDAVFLNETNTIPGMTSQSMFWVVWEAEGYDRPGLVDRLVALAFEAADTQARWAP